MASVEVNVICLYSSNYSNYDSVCLSVSLLCLCLCSFQMLVLSFCYIW